MSEPLSAPLSNTVVDLSLDSQIDRRPTNEYPQTPDGHGPSSIKSDFHNSLHRSDHFGLQGQSQQSVGASGSGSHPLSAPHEQGILPGPKRVTRAFGLRVIRTVRRGQLPFLLVFFTCVVIFFSALCGLGYEEPPTALSDSNEKEFDVGRPVFDGKSLEAEENEKVQRMKRLESEWAKQKRPKDGAWMKSNRNQREIRRKPLADSRFQRQKQQEEPDLGHQGLQRELEAEQERKVQKLERGQDQEERKREEQEREREQEREGSILGDEEQALQDRVDEDEVLE